MSDTPEHVIKSRMSVPGAPPPEDPLPGMKLGDYVVEKAVAWGGMGIVYRAVHPLLGRKVAVKVLRPTFAGDAEQAARFLLEAQAISAIKHRGIIDIITLGNLPDARPYLVMEYLEGETLEDLLRREGALDPPRALEIIDEVLDALSAAHKAGVVHRDLKPSNIYLTLQSNGARYVKLVDFGLARRATLDDLKRLDGKASLMAGTPEYLSPEQVKGVSATPRTDLYGAGVVLFEMVTGQLPFTADSVLELLNAHRVSVPPRAGTLVGGLPPMLDDFIDQCLQKQPELRPGSAEHARQTVQRILRHLKEDKTRVAQTLGPPQEDEHTVRHVPRRDAETDRVAAPRESATPTAPELATKRIPVWGWAAAAAAVLVGAALVVSSQTPEEEVAVGPSAPQPVLAPVSEPNEVAVPVPDPVPPEVEEPVKEPVRKEPVRKEPVRKERREPVRAAKAVEGPTPEACEGSVTKWKSKLNIAFDIVEQSYIGKMRGKTDPVADREFGVLRARIKTMKDLGDCLQVFRGLEGWQKKHLN